MKNSHFRYSFKLGGAVGQVNSNFPVSDGQWHTVTVVRKGTIALVFMDDESRPTAAQAKGKIGQLRAELGDVYLGKHFG